MAPLLKYDIEFVVPEDCRDNRHRGVAFLLSSDTRVTAKSAFDKLDEKSEWLFRQRFDNWKDNLINKKWYHRWNKSEFKGKYTECFVFKARGRIQGNKSEHRLYGFLYNPKTPQFDQGYQICVLVNYALKEEKETDESDLRVTEEIRVLPVIKKAIDDYFKRIL